MALTNKREAMIGNKPKDISYETVIKNKTLSEFVEDEKEE